MQTISTAKKRLADLGLFYAAAIWGSTFFVVKDSLDFINPVILVGYRFAIAALLMAGVCVIMRKPLFTNISRGFWLGILLWLVYVAQTIGLGMTTASNSGFITGLFVPFVPILGLILFKRIPDLMGTIATLVSLAGLWVLTGGLRDINHGDMLTLITAAAYAAHILYTDRFLARGHHPITLCFQQFLFVGAASLIVGAVFNLPFTFGNISTGGIILFLAVFPSFSAFIIQTLAQKFTSPIRVSLIFAFEPVFAALFAWTLGGEQFISQRALGGLLIFLAMLISGLPPDILRRKRKV